MYFAISLLDVFAAARTPAYATQLKGRSSLGMSLNLDGVHGNDVAFVCIHAYAHVLTHAGIHQNAVFGGLCSTAGACTGRLKKRYCN